MCRWFAYISNEEPVLLSDVLITPANSISKQVSEHFLPHLLPHDDDKDLHHSHDRLIRMRNSLLNMDGLGLAWYTSASSSYLNDVEGRRPALYKSQQPPINDFNFRSLCENTETHCLFAHIRASSGAVITPANCHPFHFGRHIFMHNGVISGFSEIRRDLAHKVSHDAFCNILGATDSELVAALYITNLTDGGTKETWEQEYPLKNMLEAMTKTMQQVMDMQLEILKDQASPNSMNFCTTDGKVMLGIRFRNHATQQPPSLYWSKTAGRSLNSKYPGSPDDPDKVNTRAVKTKEDDMGKHAIIASEPTTYDKTQWHLIQRNCALLVDEHGAIQEVPIPYDAKYNVEDPWAPKPETRPEVKRGRSWFFGS